ncbi:hypothetical protein AB0O07_13115 [Streptomyces sp. NPDC093085]|uniref:hypothetical protein n=1 Tax=Streptomyces sp. NPDC093085 TaxID=3155068 RepID=UPI00342326BD
MSDGGNGVESGGESRTDTDTDTSAGPGAGTEGVGGDSGGGVGVGGGVTGRRVRSRARWVAGAVAGAVLVSGIGLWATDTWPFRDTYCWGAWQQNSGAYFLGEKALGTSGSERKATESAPPSADRPDATCTVTVNSTVPDDDADEPLRFKERVTVDYGPVPESAEKRRAWIARNFHGSVSPLPDGLTGLVGTDRAMLVLPEKCDTADRPSVVTLRTESRGDGHLGKVFPPFAMGTRTEVAQMLLDVADATMRQAGCAPSAPLSMTSPLITVAEKEQSAARPLCRIPGVTFDLGEEYRFRQQVGTVGDRLQTCSMVWSTLGVPDEPAAQYVMAGEPRLAAIFDGLPEGAAHGLVHAMCDGRRTAFYGHVDPGGQGRGVPDDQQVFENFTRSVSRRIGCDTGNDNR